MLTKREKQQKLLMKQDDSAMYDFITVKLKDELKDKQEQPRPEDLLKRLEDILTKCAIIPSAKRGR